MLISTLLPLKKDASYEASFVFARKQ